MAESVERLPWRESWAEYKRLATVEDLLDDINAAAWASMERRDFADSSAELSKLAAIKADRTTVRAETDAALARYLAAVKGRASRGIERSR
ncbi:hypothetical protein [Nocardia puris]|uniref:hypothetical protein n=1 Tax=Nocardia puris TaxID=208602 RepID=UPI002E1ED9E6